MFRRPTPGAVALLYMAFATLWIVASDRLLALVVADHALLLRIGMFKGLAFVFVTGGLLFLLLQASREPLAEDGPGRALAVARPQRRRLVFTFLGLALTVPLIGFGIVALEGPRIRQAAFEDLRAIADLKAGQIESWLGERRGDAEVLAVGDGFVDDVEEFVLSGSATARRHVARRLDAIEKVLGYETDWLDARGGSVLRPGAAPDAADQGLHAPLARALQSGDVQYRDLYRDALGRIRLDFIVPLLRNRSAGERQALGAVVLHAPVERFLFPLIQSWPTSSPSAETVLVRRDGDSVLFLNELRHRKDAALTYRFPLDSPGLPAAVSIYSGDAQVMEGIDYRGISVLAAVRPVHGTPWRLVAKVDREEVLAPLQDLVFWVSLVDFFAIAVVTAAVSLLWRQQQHSHRLALIAQAAEKDRLLKLFYDLPFVGMAITSPATKRWLHVNDRLCEMLGYPRETLLQTNWAELTHPADLAVNMAHFERLLAGEIDAYRMEKRFIRRDGINIDVLLDIKCVRRPDGIVDSVVAMIQDITERKRAETVLRQSEERYRSLFENMLEGYAYCRMLIKHDIPRDFVYLAVNSAFETLTGLKDVVGKRVSEVIPGIRQANPELFEIYARVATTGRPERFETYVDGLGIWFSIAVYSPKKKYFIAVFDNITERKRAEQALRKSEERLALVLKGANDASWDWDLAGDAVYYSPQWWAMLGYQVDELPADSGLWRRLTHPEDLERVDRALSDALADGRDTVEAEFRLRHKDGHSVPILARAFVMRDAAGKAVRLSGTSMDLTERKQNEARLRQAATVFESTREAVMVVDTGKRILMVNRAFTTITGYSETEAIGQTPAILTSGRHDGAFYAAMWQDINSVGSWQGEIWNRRKNGEVYPELLSISTVRGDNGQVSHYVGVFADISKLKTTEAQLDFIAYHDPLTRLPNRLLLFSRLQHSLDVARREGRQLALLMLDLDRFKDVNDSYGHLAGDELLQRVAERLTSRLRGVDTVTRLGGDEFTLLLEDITHPQDAARVADEIITALSEPWRLSNGAEVRIGASVGISLFPGQGGTPEELLQQADAALYRAKNQGRGCFKYFSDDLTRSARQRVELEARLRRAIAESQLRVHYQPQVQIASGRIVGAEALVRWQDPVDGLIPPGRFIPVAEETGLIGDIGMWVLGETCRQGVRWLEAGLPPLTLAVNLSPHQFRHGDIGATVGEVLRETGYPAEWLELELTESALMEREEDAVAMLTRLRTLGIRLAIDDFGTGYSSLAYLKRFPLDVLKIDKRFVDDIPRHRDDREIAATIVAMGHTLGFKVLAEGVETAEQLAFLKAQGCDLYQGYIASPPLPAEGFAELFRQGLKRNL